MTTVDLTSNRLGDEGTIFLANMMKTQSQVTALHLANVQMGDAGFRALCKMVEVNGVIEDLNVEGNQISAEVSALALKRALAKNTHLKKLNLRANSLGDKAVSIIGQGLKNNKTLVYLDVRCARLRALCSPPALTPCPRDAGLARTGGTKSRSPGRRT